MDGLFLDYLMCLRSTLFVGSSKSKISKQIVSLREAVDLPSFILKPEAPADEVTRKADRKAPVALSEAQQLPLPNATAARAS